MKNMIKIPNDARVCFVGDSITANNDYISYVQDYFYKKRNSNGIKFYNCGVSGGSCVSQLTYFDDDTARHNPTHIFIMLGVNDSWRDRLAEPKSAQRYALLKERYELYKENLEKLYEKSKSRTFGIYKRKFDSKYRKFGVCVERTSRFDCNT